MESARIKDSYTISEVSLLFGMGIDSLRYYERLGIITPRRAANGYRLYELDDMYKLALIKDLRRLDVPMKAIKAYLDQQNLTSTLALLQDEERLLDERIGSLLPIARPCAPMRTSSATPSNSPWAYPPLSTARRVGA